MKKRYTEEQIIRILREVQAGQSIASVSRAHGVTEQTIYRWRNEYDGLDRTQRWTPFFDRGFEILSDGFAPVHAA
jgi:putative transposase